MGTQYSIHFTVDERKGRLKFVATRKCGNVYFSKYFMAVRKFTNIFVLSVNINGRFT